MNSIQISFICKGNICRSCYAEHKLRAILGAEGAERVQVRSFGLDTRTGLPADPSAINIAKARGVDLSKHLTTPFDLSFVDTPAESHLLLPMELGQLSRIKSLLSALPPADQPRIQAFPLSQYSGDAIKRRLFPNIRDPWGHNESVFHSTFDRIDDCLNGLLVELRNRGALR